MRRSEKQLTDEETAELLKKGEVMYISLADGGVPYGVAMNYGYKDGAVYLHCAYEGRKMDIIKKNPKVAFMVVTAGELIKKETSCGWTCAFTSVMGDGTIEIVTGDAEKRAGLDALMEHYGRFENSYADKMVERTCVLKLTIENCTGKTSPAPAKGE
ncbi:MAG: pyridoxamine 5'-phosphate oxidase family protein [Deferribacterales bacterium]